MRRQCEKRTTPTTLLLRIAPPWFVLGFALLSRATTLLDFRRRDSDGSRTGAGERAVRGGLVRRSVRARFSGPLSMRKREEGMASIETDAASKATTVVLMCIIKC